MPWFVYVLQSQQDQRLYVGMTRNIQQRFAEHSAGYVFSTKGYRPWTLVYQERCDARPEARKREKYLKSGSGKEWLKSFLMPR
ncbi:GIY-YIG nuclease family protein [Candidatus Uhrbacteria bacterium]|nr:GIY-YIG nuclease family protein [Candidatus Uhrbacteria bacterium]